MILNGCVVDCHFFEAIIKLAQLLPLTISRVQGASLRTTEIGGMVMKRCMITITTLLEDNSGQTLVLDISQRGVSVNCPRCSDIEIDSCRGDSHFELFCKIPETEEELHVRFKDPSMKWVLDQVEGRAA